MTEALFRTDPYAREFEGHVVGVNERGGIVLDRTLFYATAGGQPGDVGRLEIEGLGPVVVGATVYDAERQIVHVPAAALNGSASANAAVKGAIDWAKRYQYMRMHTAMHLLCALVKFPITGAQIGLGEGRIDFDIPEAGALDKDEIEAALNRLVTEDHPVGTRLITEEELDAKPELVRTLTVKPPRGSGTIRLVAIGKDGEIDLQPCGGTHVRATGEIGPLKVGKIEKKGRQNRRIRIAFAG